MFHRTTKLFLIGVLIGAFAIDAHAQASVAVKALVKSQIIQGVISTGFDLLKEYLSKKASASTDEIQIQQRKIRELEARLQQLSEETRPKPQVERLSQAVSAIRNDYSGLIRARSAGYETRMGNSGWSDAQMSDRARALTAALESLQNYQSQNSAGIPIYIRDELGPNQWIEEVDIYLAGIYVAKLMVNGYYPKASVRIDMAGEGVCPYTIVAQAMFFDQFGVLYPARFYGQGVIQFRRGTAFELGLNDRGSIEMRPAQ